MNKIDVLLVSNYSNNLNEFHEKVVSNFPKSIKYKILTYRKTNIENAYSYEEFLEENIESIESFNIETFNEKYKNTNLYLAVVCERLFVNYYSGTEKTLGNYNLSFEEINFLIKSFTLFLEPFIINSKVIFGGYADNFISTLAFKICENFKKKIYSFQWLSVINNHMAFLVEGIYYKPILSKNPPLLDVDYDLSNIENYDVKKHLKSQDVVRGLLGVVSSNFVEIHYWKQLLSKTRHDDKRLIKFLNLDRPSMCKKISSNLYRLISKQILNYKFSTLGVKKIENQKFVYFPLQIQPEASSGTLSPFNMNMKMVVENISKSLPLGYLLLIKEHPLAVGYKNIDFYNSLLILPNVQIVSMKISGKELIQKSSLIITYGGTTLFEAISYGKKVLLLSEDYAYKDEKLVKVAGNISSLKEQIRKFIELEINSDYLELAKQKMYNFFFKRGFDKYINLEKSISERLLELIENE